VHGAPRTECSKEDGPQEEQQPQENMPPPEDTEGAAEKEEKLEKKKPTLTAPQMPDQLGSSPIDSFFDDPPAGGDAGEGGGLARAHNGGGGFLGNIMQQPSTSNIPRPQKSPLGAAGQNTMAIKELKDAIAAIGNKYRVPRDDLKGIVTRAVAELLSGAPHIQQSEAPPQNTVQSNGIGSFFPPTSISDNTKMPDGMIGTGAPGGGG